MRELLHNEVQNISKYGFVIYILNKNTELWEKQETIYPNKDKCLDALHKIRKTQQAYFDFASNGEEVKQIRKAKMRQYNKSYNKIKESKNGKNNL